MKHPLIKRLLQGLGLVNPVNNSVLRNYVPTNKIRDFKEIKGNIIIQEEPAQRATTSNIYCLDLQFNILWRSEVPFPNDYYPNTILWDSKINKNTSLWGEAYQPDSSCFTTSSISGITVTIDYDTGKILDRLLTK